MITKKRTDVLRYPQIPSCPNPVSMFEARHGDNTDVLLALLTQNKELEGKAKLKTLKLEWSGQSPVDIAVIINAVPRSF